MSNSERPRDVFLAGCKAIGGVLAASGFNSTERGQLLRREHGHFVESIHFQSSHYNRVGHVVIIPSAAIDSVDLGRWRGDASGVGDRVAGVNIGHLDGSGWATWDLGDPAPQVAAIDSIVQAVNRHVLPWFELVEDPDALAGPSRGSTRPTRCRPWHG